MRKPPDFSILPKRPTKRSLHFATEIFIDHIRIFWHSDDQAPDLSPIVKAVKSFHPDKELFQLDVWPEGAVCNVKSTWVHGSVEHYILVRPEEIKE